MWREEWIVFIVVNGKAVIIAMSNVELLCYLATQDLPMALGARKSRKVRNSIYGSAETEFFVEADTNLHEWSDYDRRHSES